MTLSTLRNLFLVAFLGATLVGCSSSGPVVEDANAEATAAQDAAAKKAAEEKAAAEAKAAAAQAEANAKNIPTNAAGQTADEILAAIQGKVVHFEFDRSEVQTSFRDLVRLNADYMSLNTEASVTLKGHADERGTPEYNLALGERRGDAVKNALVAEGVSPSRISVISFGEEHPVDAAHTESAWSQNRRVEFSY